MKIQQTTIVETSEHSALVKMQISDHKELEQSKQYVVCSVLVPTDPPEPHKGPIPLPVLQARTLRVVAAQIGPIEDQLVAKRR